MKRGHITLPALQFAAAAFFATTALAETYCVDQDHKVVAAANCDGASTVFTEVEGPAGVAVGRVVPHRTVRVARDAAPAPHEGHAAGEDEDMESGGFGYVEGRDSTTTSKAPRPSGS
jgi:hypothetical protein